MSDQRLQRPAVATRGKPEGKPKRQSTCDVRISPNGDIRLIWKPAER